MKNSCYNIYILKYMGKDQCKLGDLLYLSWKLNDSVPLSNAPCTLFDFQIKRTYARGTLRREDIYIFWFPEVQGVQKYKFRRATPLGGGVSLGVVLEEFWDIQNVAWGHNSLSFKFQPSRSNTTPGAVWRRCKITPNTPLSTMRADDSGKYLSLSPVGKLAELPRLSNAEKS